MEQQRGVCSFTPDRSAGCGDEVSTGQHTMRLSIISTTGCPVELSVPRGETVEGLRTRISQNLRLQTDRIVLLHKDRQLTTGKLSDHGVTDGSKLTLVPVIEAGLVCSTARAERTMMDVLESLTEVQISDFLSGHSPLTVKLGIGAHMMYVQLQLSAQDVKDLQQDGELTVKTNEQQTGLPKAGRARHPDSASAWPSTSTTGFTTPPADSNQPSTQRPRVSCISAAPASTSSFTVPGVNHHHSSSHPPHCTHTSSCLLSTPSLLSGCPHPSCPPPAATPVCSPAPTGFSPDPPSPVPASICTKSNVNASSAAEPCKQPGAVIKSFVSHSPGVFSGTFSGTLPPCSQSVINHPRRGIAIIVQILNDLLSAAYSHQRAPSTLPQHPCPALNHSVSPVHIVEEQSKARANPPVTRRVEHFSKAPGDESHSCSSTQENQTMHCKLKRLQLLMHQRRLHRWTRRTSHLSQASHPYQRRHHHP